MALESAYARWDAFRHDIAWLHHPLNGLARLVLHLDGDVLTFCEVAAQRAERYTEFRGSGSIKFAANSRTKDDVSERWR